MAGLAWRDATVDQVQRFDGLLEQLGGGREDRLFELEGGVLGGVAHVVDQATARRRARVRRRGCVAAGEVDLIERNRELVGGDDAERRVRSLSQIDGAGEQAHTPALGELQRGAAGKLRLPGGTYAVPH